MLVPSCFSLHFYCTSQPSCNLTKALCAAVHTTAGAVYHQIWKHLWDELITKPDPEPVSVADTSDVSNKHQTHMHAPQKPYTLHAPAATPPKFVAHQCITHSEQPCTPAKPAAAANT